MQARYRSRRGIVCPRNHRLGPPRRARSARQRTILSPRAESFFRRLEPTRAPAREQRGARAARARSPRSRARLRPRRARSATSRRSPGHARGTRSAHSATTSAPGASQSSRPADSSSASLAIAVAVDVHERAAAPRAGAPAPTRRLGFERASGAMPSPDASPFTKRVLPAPSGPESSTIAPAASIARGERRPEALGRLRARGMQPQARARTAPARAHRAAR